MYPLPLKVAFDMSQYTLTPTYTRSETEVGDDKQRVAEEGFVRDMTPEDLTLSLYSGNVVVLLSKRRRRTFHLRYSNRSQLDTTQSEVPSTSTDLTSASI